MLSSISNTLFGSGKKENENPELAMREALDAKDEFKILDDTTMDFADLCTFRCIVERQALRYNFEKNEANKKRSVELWKKNPLSQEYAQAFQDSFKCQADAGKHMTTAACEWIDWDLKSFHKTMYKYSQEDQKEKLQELNSKL